MERAWSKRYRVVMGMTYVRSKGFVSLHHVGNAQYAAQCVSARFK